MNASTREAIDSLFKDHPVKQYKRGQVLILPGEGTDYAYYLVKGRMKVYDISHRGDEITVDIFKEPALFPLSLILNQSTTRYIYEADSDIEIRQAPVAEALAFLNSHSDVVLDFMSRLYDTLDDVLDRMIHLVAHSAKNRIIHELIVMCRQIGEPQPGGGFSLAMTEKDLGAKIGLSRETVSREMRGLKERELLAVHHKHIYVVDLVHLEDYEHQHR